MTVPEFFEAIRNGQKHFVNLDFEDEKGFAGKDFSGVTFESCFLYVDFRNCNLTNAKFISCNLKEIDLRHTNLTNASMNKCLVESAMFSGANLTNFEFKENYFFGHTLYQDDLKELIKGEEKRMTKAKN
jgi:uncharacterized protein YjbI with pentapeptide repeats